ncbi:hypothetical protein QQM79_02710 [Marinobacteraceae bacterium S3BR75-40.1]
MTTTTVILFQVAVVALFIWMIAKVYRLYRRQDLEAATGFSGSGSVNSLFRMSDGLGGSFGRATEQYTRADWMAQAQMLAGIQMLDAKRKGLPLKELLENGCRHLAGAYLCGAATGIVLGLEGERNDTADVAAFLLNHNLKMDSMDVQETLDNLTRGDDVLCAYRCGLEGAETWLERKYVPDDVSLYQAVTTSAFI